MDLNTLYLVGSSLLGIIVASIYFKREIRMRADKNLTIEAIIHEMRTPLTGVSWIFNSLSELKQGDSIDQDILDLIKEGQNKAGNAVGLANDAMTALHTSAEYASYKFSENNIVEIVNKVVGENSLGAREKSIVVELEVGKDVAPFSFDRIKMTLVVRNIISNAIKFTPNGGRVSVKIYKEDKQIVIAVSDTGIGIPETDKDKLFAKFFRAKNIGGVSGSGLGLFIVKNIVAGHGGRIDIQSKEGQGTTVAVYIPIR